MTHYEKIKRIANHYGFRHQAIKTAEECSELSAALCKLVGGEGGRAAVIDEIADAMVMIQQMRYLMHIDRAKLDRAIDTKVDRQLERMKNEKPLDKSKKRSIIKNHNLMQDIGWYQELYDRSRIENKPGACF